MTNKTSWMPYTPLLFLLASVLLPYAQKATPNKGEGTTKPSQSIENNQAAKAVWIDADLAVGMKRNNRPGYSDVDDGFAILQLMKSDAVDILGISTVFGNTSVANADSLAQFMVEAFASSPIPVYRGAAQAIDLEAVDSNPAVEALAKALQRQKMTILAIGPATNVGILLLKYPELSRQIEEVILVAGRRKSTDFFNIGTKGRRAPDLNFDLDNEAFRLLFQHQLPVTLCPFEISSKVWIRAGELNRLATGDAGTKWLAEHSRPWLQQWVAQGVDGFNPFDVLASHYLLHPEDIISEALNARLEIHPNDQVSETQSDTFKPYLICDRAAGYPVKYCYGVSADYPAKLMNTFLNNTK